MDAILGHPAQGVTRLDELLTGSRQLAGEQLLHGARALFAQFAARLDRHMRLQEHVLFPPENRHCVAAPATAALVQEHARLRVLVADACAALDHDDAEAFGHIAELLARRLRGHHRRERRALGAAGTRRS